MIKFVELDGWNYPAIIIKCIDDIQAVRDLRKSLIDIMETCVSSDAAKDFTSSTSLWHLIRLIDETTVECPEKKGDN